MFDSTDESRSIHRWNSENYANIDFVNNTVTVIFTYKCLRLEIKALAHAHTNTDTHTKICRENFKHRILSWNITT